MEQLRPMGFTEPACQRACLACDNRDVEVALNWLMEHQSDANLNDPLSLDTQQQQPPAAVDEDNVQMIAEMGFSRAQVCACLCVCVCWCSAHGNESNS